MKDRMNWGAILQRRSYLLSLLMVCIALASVYGFVVGLQLSWWLGSSISLGLALGLGIVLSNAFQQVNETGKGSDSVGAPDNLLLTSPCLAYWLDRDGVISHSTKSFAALFNVAAEQLIGQREQHFFDNITTQKIDTDWASLQSSEDNVEYEYSFVDSRGMTRWLHVVKTPHCAGFSDAVMCVATEVTAQKIAEDQAASRQQYDQLTGLPNRPSFYAALQGMFDSAADSKQKAAVLIVDLDRFHVINDTLGQRVGDELLQAVSERLGEQIASTDLVARLADDEFGILLAGSGGRAARRAAERILASFAIPFQVSEYELIVTGSIGIAVAPTEGQDAETLLKHANRALYMAKDHGKNTYRSFQADKYEVVSRQFALEGYLRKALARNEFHLYYQPKMNIKTGELIGMEALIRWNHPHLGMISPAEFIPLAEETGLIVPIGEWVIETACKQNRAWIDAGFPPLKVSVNLSVRQFQHNLLKTVKKALTRSRLPARYLELEITESLLVQNEQPIITVLKELKALGVDISIDDFGTGYCSLSYLKHFPLSTLKIAQPFIRDISTGGKDVAIATALITLGHSLGLTVIAEGVETENQLRVLREQHCDEIQGYYLSRPLAAGDFERWVQEELLKRTAM